MTTPPFVVNLAPTPDELSFGLTDPIRLSLRDADTFIAPDSVKITVGYAQIKADGTRKFEEVVPRTTRSSILPGTIDLHTEPDIITVSEGVSITKTVDANQTSVYVTRLDAASGFHSFIGTAVVTPTVISPGQPGGIFGLENGPRNTGVYVLFENSSGPIIRLSGPTNSIGVRSPNIVVSFDWSGTNRYILVWNEVSGDVELYLIDSSGSTVLLSSAPISSFQEYDDSPGGTPRKGGDGDITLLYGIEGRTGEQIIIGNVAVTVDVGFPIIGLTRTGDYLTTRQTDEFVRYLGGDPKRSTLSPWFGPDNLFFSSPDPAGIIKVLPNKTARLVKTTLGSSMALYREEPGFLTSSTNGFLLESTFFGTPTQLIDAKISGMGYLIHDGQTVFYLALLVASTRTIGLLRRGKDPSALASFQIPITPIDWSSPTKFRFVVDPHRQTVELYGNDISTPIFSMPFDRSQLPQSSEFNLTGAPAFISFGHIPALNTLGSFELTNLTYACTYQAYEARDGLIPSDIGTSPQWTAVSGGVAPDSLPNPLFNTLLGAGYGLLPIGLFNGALSPPVDTVLIDNSQLVIETSKGSTHIYTQNLGLGPDRGVAIEARLQIVKFKPRSRTGYFIIIDDGINFYSLSFIDTEIGKFVCVPLRSDSSFIEGVGLSGPDSKFSVLLDWTSPHIYRFERRPQDGTYLFIDNSATPAIFIPESSRTSFPLSQFPDTPTIGFGHFKGEGARSLTSFVRVMTSRGYEISIKKVDNTHTLEQDIKNTQAIVVTNVADDD